MQQPRYSVLAVLASSFALLVFVTVVAISAAPSGNIRSGQRPEDLTTTPFPTIVLPPMTPVPTLSVPWDQEPETREPVPTPWRPDANAPYERHLSAYRLPDIRLATERSEIVLVGRVKEVGAPRWSTDDGRRPLDPFADGNGVYIIFRPVMLSVEQLLKGSKLTSEVLVEAVGGSVAQDAMTWGDDLYDFREGDRVLVFLQPARSGPGQLLEIEKRPMWKLYERYSITPDGEALNSYESLPLAQALETIQAVITNR